MYQTKHKTIEVMKSFFPRLRDICRRQRKALFYKPVEQFGLTLIGVSICVEISDIFFTLNTISPLTCFYFFLSSMSRSLEDGAHSYELCHQSSVHRSFLLCLLPLLQLNWTLQCVWIQRSYSASAYNHRLTSLF